MTIYAKGTKLVRDDGVEFTADGSTDWGKSYKTTEVAVKPATSATKSGLKTGQFNYADSPKPAVADPKAEISRINSEANQNQQSDFDTLKQETDVKVDVSSSSALANRLLATLDEKDEVKAPSLVEEFNRQRQALGVGALEDELSGLDAELAKLDTDYQNEFEREGDKQVSIRVSGRKQSALEKSYIKSKQELQNRRQYVADRLDTKMATINTMVNLTGRDYENATQKYDADFNKALQITNLIRGIESEEKNEKEVKTDNARANVQVMYNLLKEGKVKFETLDPATKTSILKMELQAGLPPGFVKFVSDTVEDPAVSFLPPYTDVNGNRIQPVATVNKATGAYSIKNISIGKAKDEGGGTDIISQATINKLGAAGVPKDIAVDIQNAVNKYGDYDLITKHLKAQVGDALAKKYLEAFKSVMSGTGLVEIPSE